MALQQMDALEALVATATGQHDSSCEQWLGMWECVSECPAFEARLKLQDKGFDSGEDDDYPAARNYIAAVEALEAVVDTIEEPSGADVLAHVEYLARAAIAQAREGRAT